MLLVTLPIIFPPFPQVLRCHKHCGLHDVRLLSYSSVMLVIFPTRAMYLIEGSFVEKQVYSLSMRGSSWHWKIFTVGGDHLNFLSWQMRWFIKRLIDTRTGRLEQASCHMPSPCVFIEQHTEFGSCRLHMGWIASQEIQMTMTNIQGWKCVYRSKASFWQCTVLRIYLRSGVLHVFWVC